MVNILPPHLSGRGKSYIHAYNAIVLAHWRSPLTSASSVIIFVAPDVDALCAARMFAILFKRDDIGYRMIPVSKNEEVMEIVEGLVDNANLDTILLLNMGNILDLPRDDYFGKLGLKVVINVIDSSRPISLTNLFMGGPNGRRVLIWDHEDSVTNLSEEKNAWEVVEVIFEYINLEPELTQISREDSHEDGMKSKRNSTLIDSTRYQDHGVQRRRLFSVIDKYYQEGSWYAQSASTTVYMLATLLKAVDNDLLWLAIIGFTSQYISGRISRKEYDVYQSIYFEEISRLNPKAASSTKDIRPNTELRLTHLRHWSLYDSMLHSNYFASRIEIWKDKGRRRLIGLLAKIGFSISEAKELYLNMDLDLKGSLTQRLLEIAPEYGLTELLYPSFERCHGYQVQSSSAADAAEGLGALLEVDPRIPLDDELYFTSKDRQESTEYGRDAWIDNFWRAYDTLCDMSTIQNSIDLSMTLKRAIVRQGTSIIEKQGIHTMRNYRVVVLSRGQDLSLFSHPGMLRRLIAWLCDVLRYRISGHGVGTLAKKYLYFVVACLCDADGTYSVMGTSFAFDFDTVVKNHLSYKFIDTARKIRAEAEYATFENHVLRLPKSDLQRFLEQLVK
ncbi:hypothetical protein HYPSUDRAFT_67056 [Hypholoma sublateritium FD-334 SS-4]|uniref:Cell division control protein 45 n=1 Tax=Hypholoma sublateritium (strain FD-334 SS-4) TaxID=945553 RepID=A0A0D2PR42_HYPSF|nr:hypothetical protein HYPSUDRAFT_67056 [Hypholoma sublateritium FD-334 SS-4]